MPHGQDINTKTDNNTIVQEFGSLNRFIRAIKRDLSIQSVCQTLASFVLQAVEADLVRVFLLDSECQPRLEHHYSTQPLALPSKPIEAFCQTLCNQCVKENRPIYSTPGDPILKMNGMKIPLESGAAIPIQGYSDTLGVLVTGCLGTEHLEALDPFLHAMAAIAGLNIQILTQQAQINILNKTLNKTQKVSEGKEHRDLEQVNRALEKQILNQKAMEQEVLKREAMLNMVGSMVRAGGWQFDLDNEALLWTRYVYEIHEVDTDYQPEIETAILFYVPEHRQRITDLVLQCIEKAIPYDEELEIISAKGNRVPVRAKGEPVIKNGRVVKLVGSFQDISDRKKIENEMIEAKNQAEQSNLSKTRFLGRMGHEFRTPLNMIIGMTELSLEDRLTADQADRIKAVQKSAWDMKNLFDNILYFSSIEQDEIEVQKGPFDLKLLLDEINKRFQKRTATLNLDLIFLMAEKMPLWRLGDPQLIRKTLTLVIENAIKFTPSGMVIVDVFEPSPGHISFRIQDTGIGISSDQAYTLFESFNQGDNSRTRRYGGVGLGLTIAEKLIRRMGGKITITGNEGWGCDVKIDFHDLMCIENHPENQTMGQPDGERVRTRPHIQLQKSLSEWRQWEGLIIGLEGLGKEGTGFLEQIRRLCMEKPSEAVNLAKRFKDTCDRFHFKALSDALDLLIRAVRHKSPAEQVHWWLNTVEQRTKTALRLIHTLEGWKTGVNKKMSGRQSKNSRFSKAEKSRINTLVLALDGDFKKGSYDDARVSEFIHEVSRVNAETVQSLQSSLDEFEFDKARKILKTIQKEVLF